MAGCADSEVHRCCAPGPVVRSPGAHHLRVDAICQYLVSVPVGVTAHLVPAATFVKHGSATGIRFGHELDPIDRLEDKIKLLVQMVTRLRNEQTKAADDNARLVQEIDMLRARIAGAQGMQAELDAMRSERDAIRDRVAEMLSQLESI